MSEKHHFFHGTWNALTKGYHELGINLRKFDVFIILAVPLLCCVAGLVTYLLLAESIKSETLKRSLFKLPSPAEYPVLSARTKITISADAALVMDNTSKVIIYSKNSKFRFSPASTTKMMTSLIGLGQFASNQLLEIKTATVEGTIVGFLPGQKITFKGLLYGMLLPSGNDAALAVAQNYPGGETAFVQAMNTKAKIFGLANTHFGDPAGLTDDITYTTVKDLAHLASIFLTNSELSKIVDTQSAIINVSDGSQFYVKNLNKLLGLYGVNGVKTGHTEGAGDVLVTSLLRGGHKYIIIVMRSEDRFADTKKLIFDIVNAVTYQTIDPELQ